VIAFLLILAVRTASAIIAAMAFTACEPRRQIREAKP
jgi:hypothetical protein